MLILVYFCCTLMLRSSGRRVRPEMLAADMKREESLDQSDGDSVTSPVEGHLLAVIKSFEGTYSFEGKYFWQSSAKLSSGGFGAVFAGKSNATGALVAVKQVRLDCGRCPSIAQAQQESHIMQTLRDGHVPYVVRLITSKLQDYHGKNLGEMLNPAIVGNDSSGKYSYDVYPLAQGFRGAIDLNRYICGIEGRLNSKACLEKTKLHIPAPDGRTCSLMIAQLALAVRGSHLVGVENRDVKPKNVLLDGALSQEFLDVPKMLLTDFGQGAKFDLEKDSPGDIRNRKSWIGFTRGYETPEQIGDFARARGSVDWWDLGVTAFYLATGRVMGLEQLNRASSDPAPGVTEEMIKELSELDANQARSGGVKQQSHKELHKKLLALQVPYQLGKSTLKQDPDYVSDLVSLLKQYLLVPDPGERFNSFNKQDAQTPFDHPFWKHDFWQKYFPGDVTWTTLLDIA